MSNHDLRLLRSNGAEQDQVLRRRKGFRLFYVDHIIYGPYLKFDPLFSPRETQKSMKSQTDSNQFYTRFAPLSGYFNHTVNLSPIGTFSDQ